MQEPESLADLSVWFSVRERPVDARNGPVSGKLVCRCIVVGPYFVVVLNFRLPPLACPVVDASLYDEKRKKLLWTVELWRIVLMHYTPILFFFVENVETPYNNRRLSKEGFHNSTNPLLFLPHPFHLLQQFLESITVKGKVSSLLLRCRQNVMKRIEVVLVIGHIGRSRLQSPSFSDNVPD